MRLHFSTFPSAPSSPFKGHMRVAQSPDIANAKTLVLILPGWGEWIEKYGRTLANFEKHGYNAAILEWRGQGLSTRLLENSNKAWVPDFSMLVEDLDFFFSKQMASQKNIVILAHSMGAHIALRWWLENGQKYKSVGKIILCSPMHELNTTPFSPPLAKLVVKAACALGLGKDYAFGQSGFDQGTIPFKENKVTHNAARYAEWVEQLKATPELKCGGITFGWLRAAFDSIAWVEKYLQQKTPAVRYLVLGAEKDEIVSLKGIKRLTDFLPSCQQHYYPDAAHELLQETDTIRKQVWQDIYKFLDN